MCFDLNEGSSCSLLGSDLPQQIPQNPTVKPAAQQRAAPNPVGEEDGCKVLLLQVEAQVPGCGGLPGSVESVGSPRCQLTAEQPQLGPDGCWAGGLLAIMQNRPICCWLLCSWPCSGVSCLPGDGALL